MSRKLKMGMVGGGKDAFIGAVHRLAANLDGRIELVAGAFSSNPDKSHESGALLLLDPNGFTTAMRRWPRPKPNCRSVSALISSRL